jgi:deoxyribodipyrimidine photo-lyase
MICSPERSVALRQLADFLPAATRYSWERNAVRPGHPAVSRLSPAIRHRLLSEDEAAAAVLAAHPLPKVEKLVQEIYWRRYWKSWLSLRPGVWSDYRESLAAIDQNGGGEELARFEQGSSGNPVIDHFARELIETGYLHNHARMWFAAWWVHEARLPWELGAAFFFRHLLDGDPASNTLSWRWVAGLQTPGKTYLARRANLEKYLDRSLLESLRDGLAAFENPSPQLPPEPLRAPVTQLVLESLVLDPALPTGLWIHEEDLSPETSPLGDTTFRAILVTGHGEGWRDFRFPAAKQVWLKAALADASFRASAHWQSEAPVYAGEDLVAELVTWAGIHRLSQIVSLRPDVGPLADALPALSPALERAGIRLVWVDRPRDLVLRPLATAGFFGFWESLKQRGLLPESTLSV